jgi:hypothetical protein
MAVDTDNCRTGNTHDRRTVNVDVLTQPLWLALNNARERIFLRGRSIGYNPSNQALQTDDVESNFALQYDVMHVCGDQNSLGDSNAMTPVLFCVV